MPWKVGGNFEAVCTTCETNWKECAIAVANYLWFEVVSDVVDCLTKDGTILWLLAIAVILTILFRTKYRKNVHARSIIVSTQVLSKVGYKLHDLELKVNVLTYKMQYGTWPLPHQIYNLNPKKLRKIRTTLSNPGDRKNWIKQVLLSPVESDLYVPYSNVFNPFAAKFTNDFINVKEKDTPRRVPCGKSTDCSSIEISISTSDQSVNACSRRPGICARNASAKASELSRSVSFTTEQRRNTRLRHVDPDEWINRGSSKALVTQDGKCTTNANPCQEFTDTVRRCKTFLKQLECNVERSHSRNRSSGKSEASSWNDARATRQPALFATENRKVSREAREPAKRDEINETKYARGIEDKTAMEDSNEVYRRSNADISADVIVTSNVDATFPRQLVPILPIARPAHDVQSSRETLHEVRKRLQSLHNVLRTYGDLSRSAEGEESSDPVGEIVGAFVPIGSRIEEIDENETVTNRNADSREDSRQTQRSIVNGREYLEPDRSGESSCSLVGCSSSTSNKTYRCSSETATRDTRPKEYSLGDTARKPAWTSDHPVLTEPNGYRQHRSFYKATSHVASEYHENPRETSACERNVSDRNRGHELEPRPNVDGNVAETNASLNLAAKKSEAGRLCRISRRISAESFVDESVPPQNGPSSRRNAAAEKFSNIFNGEQYQENVIIISRCSSRSKVSKSSDTEEKSTALLLQEALHIKKALLTRIESEEKCLAARGIEERNVPHESSLERETQIESNNFPSMVLDIKAEEPITGTSHGKINQRYVHLEMKQRRDLLPRSLHNVNAHCDNERDAESKSLIAETPSEYFSISDLAIHGGNDEAGNNVPASSRPPIYEKVISITIPVDVEEQDVIDTNEKSMETKIVVGNTWTCASSRQNLRERASADDIDVANKGLPMVLKLEDLILERMRDIRNYMDTFLQSQNRAISKARRALQCRRESDTFRCSNETSHVILHNRLTASPSRADQIVDSSSDSQRPKLLINTTLPNCKREILLEDGVIKCRSDLHLRRNPGMFTLVAPTKDTFSGRNDAQRLETAREAERKETGLSLPIILRRSCENDSKSTRETGNLGTPSCREYVTSNTRNDKMNERTTANISADFQKRGKQIRNSESKFSVASYIPVDAPQDDANDARTTRDERHEARSRYNSISRRSLYLTDEVASTMKIDNVSSERASKMIHSYAKSRLLKETKQDVIKRHTISEDKRLDTNRIMPSKIANIEHSKLIGSNFISDKSGHDYLMHARTTLKESNVIYDSDAFPLGIKEKTPNTDNSSLNDTKQNECDCEKSASITHLSPRVEHHPARRLCQIYPRIKAKSDISLIATTIKDSNIDLCPKRSHSFVCHDISGYVPDILHQPNVKLHNNKSKCNEDKLRPTTPSKSTRSCIPILKNRLEAARQMKRRTHTRSPTRSPLTMLWREKICKKGCTTDVEVICGNSVPINKHSCVEETALNLAKPNTEENTLAKGLEDTNTRDRGGNVKTKDNSEMPNDRNVESLEIDKENSDKRFICDSISNTRIMERIENTALKAVTIISILANDDLLKTYPANSTSAIEKMEKEVTAKPSITDTCTSMSDLH